MGLLRLWNAVATGSGRMLVRLLPVAAGLCCFAADAVAAEQRFEIRSAYVEPSEGVYLLNAQLDFQLPEGAQKSIQEGVALTLDLEIAVQRSRGFWFDDEIAKLEQHYELDYHALSERYLVRNVNSGEQSSYPSLTAALESLKVIRGLPVLDESLVRPDARYEVSLRASLDVRSVPSALRMVLFWVDDWRQASDWYTWPLRL